MKLLSAKTLEVSSLKQSTTDTSAVLPHKAVPRGAYPHFRRAGSFVFVSGTSARNPDNSIAGVEVDTFGAAQLDIRAQTRACIENMRDILEAAGGGLDNLIEVTTFLVSMNDFAGYNEVYGEYFSHQGPARTTVAVHQLPHPHLLIEIRGVACIAEEKSKSTSNGAASHGQG
ncbi:RidA family protein [Mesorhizobium sp. ANAO-SY3R2]|uniref:RidA family protein n=1 Tax=Mesorhizobium sp. ANAO-SY3R2 TaxID=3166644 RepID=UPI003672F2F9